MIDGSDKMLLDHCVEEIALGNKYIAELERELAALQEKIEQPANVSVAGGQGSTNSAMLEIALCLREVVDQGFSLMDYPNKNEVINRVNAVIAQHQQ